MFPEKAFALSGKVTVVPSPLPAGSAVTDTPIFFEMDSPSRSFTVTEMNVSPFLRPVTSSMPPSNTCAVATEASLLSAVNVSSSLGRSGSLKFSFKSTVAVKLLPEGSTTLPSGLVISGLRFVCSTVVPRPSV